MRGFCASKPLGDGSGGFKNARFASTKTSSLKKASVLLRQNAMFKTCVFLRRNGSLAISFFFFVVENGHVLVFEQHSCKNVAAPYLGRRSVYIWPRVCDVLPFERMDRAWF